jgi:PAS domain S-box-containing protein
MQNSQADLDKFELDAQKLREDIESRASELHERGELSEEAVAELQTSIEELQVAEEELRVQNAQLSIAMDSVEAGRRAYYELFEFAPDAYLVTDLRGAVSEANSRASDMLGVQQRFLIGKPLIVFVAPESRTDFRRFLLRVLQDEGRQEFPCTLLLRDDTRMHISLAVTPARNHDGVAVALRWLARQELGQSDTASDSDGEFENRVQSATAQLRHESETKDELLGLISHEMRTPLTVIEGAVALLRRRDKSLSDDRREKLLEEIDLRSKDLSLVLQNMMSLARVQLSEMPELEPISLPVEARAAISSFKRLRPQRRIDFRVQGEPRPVNGVSQYVRQVLWNLLSNADKYSPASKPISVIISPWDGSHTARVSVTDSGEGVEAGDLDVLFEPFYRGSRHRNTSGSGLGLTVCRRLIEVQGGRICAENVAQGGLCVCFTMGASATSVA